MHDESVHALQSYASEVTAEIHVEVGDVKSPSDDGCASKGEPLA
jgi:hypothetical protein